MDDSMMRTMPASSSGTTTATRWPYFENEAGQRTAANLLTQRRSAAPEVNDPIIVVQ
jgi:hypothetical protein